MLTTPASTSSSRHVLLDLFAGTGWGVAAHKLGLTEYGVEIMKQACETREKNGFTTIYNDVWDGLLNPALVPAYTVLIASPPCFTAGAPVVTKRGVIPIEEVVVGDLVLTHKNRWRKVTDTMNRMAETVSTGYITSTPDHPFYVAERVSSWSGERYANGKRKYVWDVSEPSWVDASETQGKFLSIPHITEGSADGVPESPFSWRIVGRWLADGWANIERSEVHLGLGKHKEESLAEELVGWKRSEQHSVVRRSLYGAKGAATWLTQHFGSGAEGKTIPGWLIDAPQAVKEEVLLGYLEGDGTRSSNGTKSDVGWKFNSVSRNLMVGLRIIASSLGWATTLVHTERPKTTVIEGRTVNQKDTWTVQLNEDTGRYTRIKNGHRWHLQRKTVVPSGVQKVYDITVEEDHSFICWGYVVHNCQSYSMAGQGAGRKAMEQVLELVHDKAHEDPAKLVAAAEELGDKTVLVLAPLAHIFRDRPEHVFLEQVPSVQPVWNLYKTVLEEYGYAVWTGPVQSEMYGVPQSRRRAYLIAHRDREEAFPPPPTHSRYYARNPQKMDEGVLPWIPLADVLDEREEELPAWAYNRPSTTIVGSFRPDILAAPGYRKPGDPPRQKTPGSIQVSFREAARIQTYPEDFEFAGGLSKQYLQVGNAVPPLLAEHMLSLVLEDDED